MGVPAGSVRALLRLLFLQLNADGPADPPRLLGLSNIANGLQVHF